MLKKVSSKFTVWIKKTQVNHVKSALSRLPFSNYPENTMVLGMHLNLIPAETPVCFKAVVLVKTDRFVKLS